MISGFKAIAYGLGLIAAHMCAAAEVVQIRFGSVEPPVVAQRDITVLAAISAFGERLPLECGAAAWVGDALLLASDRHAHALFICPLDPASARIDLPRPIIAVQNEQHLLEDMEALTTRRDNQGRSWAYAMCSLSNFRDESPLPKRRHFLRVRLDRGRDGSLALADPVVINLTPLRDRISGEFAAVGVEPYRTYFAEHLGPEKNTYRWGNVEGIAFAPPDGSGEPRLICGMRNPLLNRRAILCVLGQIDAAFDARDATGIQLLDIFTLDMDGRGVSDLCWDPVTRGYLIAASDSGGPKLDNDRPYPPNTLRSALFWWSGHKQDSPIRFADVPDMKIEAICRLGETRLIAIVSDEHDVSEGRPDNQSVLTVLDFTGITIRTAKAAGADDDE